MTSVIIPKAGAAGPQGAAGPAGPAFKGASPRFYIAWDPAGSNYIAVDNHTGNVAHTGATADVVVGAAVTDLAGAAGTLSFSGDNHQFSATTTIPATVGVILPKGCTLSPDSGKALTLAGPIDAGPYQIFSGTGPVTTNPGAIREYCLEWFGGGVGAPAASNDAALVACVASWGGMPGHIRLLAGTYQVSAIMLLAIAGMRVSGKGNLATTLQAAPGSALAAVVRQDAHGILMEDLQIDGNHTATHGLLLDDDGTANGGTFFHNLTRVLVQNATSHGITNTDRCYGGYWESVRTINNGGLGYYLVGRCQNITFETVKAYDNAGATVNGSPVSQAAIGDGTTRPVNSVAFSHCDFEGLAGDTTSHYLVLLSGVQNWSFDAGCYFNSSSTAAVAEVGINGTGTYAQSYGAIKDAYGDSSSTAPAIVDVQAGATARVAVEDVYWWSSTTTTSIRDGATGTIGRLQNVYGAGLATNDTAGTPTLYGAHDFLLIGTWAGLRRGTSGQVALAARVIGDAAERFELQANGSMLWGAGSGALDTTLQRQGNGVLGTNSATDFAPGRRLCPSNQGAEQSANSIWMGSGAPGAGTVNPLAGDIYIRVDTPGTANQRIYVCVSGGSSPTWQGIL